FTAVQNQVVDLGKRAVKASSFETTGPGAGNLSFKEIGCSMSLPEKGITFCVQGSPPILFVTTSNGDFRPVSSLSPSGFQDTSTGARQACDAIHRGTFYVEKGAGNVADKPFLCAKMADNRYAWIQLGTAP